MAWWKLHRWALRILLLFATVVLAYLGIVGLVEASDTSRDGRVLAIVVGVIFLFLSVMTLWWLWIEFRRD